MVLRDLLVRRKAHLPNVFVRLSKRSAQAGFDASNSCPGKRGKGLELTSEG